MNKKQYCIYVLVASLFNKVGADVDSMQAAWDAAHQGTTKNVDNNPVQKDGSSEGTYMTIGDPVVPQDGGYVTAEDARRSIAEGNPQPASPENDYMTVGSTESAHDIYMTVAPKQPDNVDDSGYMTVGGDNKDDDSHYMTRGAENPNDRRTLDDGEPLYDEIPAKPATDYATEIAKIVAGSQENSVKSDATKLMELLTTAYTENKVEEFDTAITVYLKTASAEELPVLLQFVKNMQHTNFERLFGTNTNPLLKPEFEGLQKHVLQDVTKNIGESYIKMLTAGESGGEVQKICDKYVQEFPQEKAQFALEVQARLMKAFTGSHYTSEQLENIFDVLSTSEIFKPRGKYDWESPFAFVSEGMNKNIQTVVQTAKMNNMLRIDPPKIPSRTLNFNLNKMQESLKNQGIFDKFPRLWFRMAGKLLDTATQGSSDATVMKTRISQLNYLQKSLSKSITGKMDSFKTKVRRWFGSTCKLTTLKLKIRSQLFFRNDNVRYMQAQQFIADFNKQVQDAQAITGNHQQNKGILSVQEVCESVGILLSNLSGKEDLVGSRRNVLLDLYKLDPTGKYVMTEVIQRVPAKLQKDFITMFSDIQQGKVTEADSFRAADLHLVLDPTTFHSTGQAALDHLLEDQPTDLARRPLPAISTDSNEPKTPSSSLRKRGSTTSISSKKNLRRSTKKPVKKLPTIEEEPEPEEGHK